MLLDGDPHIAIVQEAARQGIDLIIMNSRRRPYAAGLIGSTAEEVCRIAPCPVMVTHSLENEFAGGTTNEIGLKRAISPSESGTLRSTQCRFYANCPSVRRYAGCRSDRERSRRSVYGEAHNLLCGGCTVTPP
jgi:hypothetical protein